MILSVLKVVSVLGASGCECGVRKVFQVVLPRREYVARTEYM